MHVIIAGGHGKIALRLAALLSAHGDEVRSLIRNPEHEPDVRETGAQAVLCDLEAAGEEAMAECVGGADAVVFAAGAGPGSGTERKETVDFGGWPPDWPATVLGASTGIMNPGKLVPPPA